MTRKPAPRAMRTLPTDSLEQWECHKPAPWMAKRALDALLRAVPEQWRQPIELSGLGKLDLTNPDPAPIWLQSWDAMQAIHEFDNRFGRASSWNLTDGEICEMAKRLVAEAQELDAGLVAEGSDVPARLDAVRLLLRMLGVQESKPLAGEPDIKRAHDPAWWRRLLRKHVARVVEAGAVRLGIVNRKQGGYASDLTVRRREAQIHRNQEALKRSLFKNEAGQIWTLAELSALSPSNPVIRGGELMTRIRGAEEYADARNHVGLFLTFTAPSKFHPMTVGAGGKPRPNPKYDGVSTPRDAQQWLRKCWARLRAHLDNKQIKIYGIRVAEPHHDATPHWHMLIWTETEAEARYVELAAKVWWLKEYGDEKGAAVNRVNCKRMESGGAAGYVAKYIAKSVGHAALADHLDVVQGQLWDVEQNDMPGHRRVDAWAACWGIRQFQAIGMPSVCVWRELRRVGKDQINALHVSGDTTTMRAWVACHREGDIQANWRVYMEAMGGHCVGRTKAHLRMAYRPLAEGACNQYGEALRVGRVVGLQTRRGQWLVSRRMAWSPVAAETETFNPDTCTDSDSGCSLAVGEARAALPRAWTGFNNCRVRLTGELRRALLGRGTHEAEDCLPVPIYRTDAEWRSIGPSPIPFF